MTYEEFVRVLGSARISIRQFADLTRKRPNSVTNNAKKGFVPNDTAIIATLLVRLEALNVDTAALLDGLNLDLKQPRGSGIGKFGGDKQRILFPASDLGIQAGGSSNTETKQGAKRSGGISAE